MEKEEGGGEIIVKATAIVHDSHRPGHYLLALHRNNSADSESNDPGPPSFCLNELCLLCAKRGWSFALRDAGSTRHLQDQSYSKITSTYRNRFLYNSSRCNQIYQMRCDWFLHNTRQDRLFSPLCHRPYSFYLSHRQQYLTPLLHAN